MLRIQLIPAISAFLFSVLLVPSLSYSAIENDTCYLIRSNNGTFLSATEDNEFVFSAVSKTRVCVEQDGEGKYTFRIPNRRYISANQGGDFQTVNNKAAWEIFSGRNEQDGSTTLRSFHNSYLGVDVRGEKLVQLDHPPLDHEKIYFLEEFIDHAPPQLKECYFLQSENGQFLSQPRPNEFVFGPKENRSLFCLKDQGDNRFAIKSACGDYLSADSELGFVTAKSPAGWEIFAFEQVQSDLFLKTFHGTLVGVDPATHRLIQLPALTQKGQKLFFVPAANHYRLQAVDGDHLSFSKDRHWHFSSAAEESNILFFETQNNGEIFIRSACGDYLSANPDLSFTQVPRASGWESFKQDDADDGSFHLKTFHQTYIGVDFRTKTLTQLQAPPQGNQRLFWKDGRTGQTNRRPVGYELFETPLSSRQLRQLRFQFLNSTPVVQPSKGLNRFNVNAERGPQFQPKSPIVHLYQSVGVLAPLVVKLPDSFRGNIPKAIQNQISKYDITELDILFTPQLYQGETGDVSLKPAFWMFPNRPNLDEIVGSPPEYQNSALMAIYGPDYEISKQVKLNKLNKFRVSLHDGKVSPNTGHLNFEHISEQPYFSFYSLVIFQEQKRAAVTLHWLISWEYLTHMNEFLNTSLQRGEKNTFGNLLEMMDAENSPFHGTPMMEKLRRLTRPQSK